MPYTYILYSQKLNKYYVGACIDLQRRMYEHNIGHSKFTSTGLPLILKYSEELQPWQKRRRENLSLKK